MKKIILYYSYSGHTKAEAQKLAKAEHAELREIKDVKKPGKIGAYLRGCPAAMGMKSWPIQPLGVDLPDYEWIVLMAPVWAGHPAPAFNSAVDILPKNAKVTVVMVSGGGTSSAKDKIAAKIAEKGCELVAYRDIKASQNAQ